jgi:hypothetical protein
MTRVNTPLSRSKSAILFVLVASGISLAIPACKKDDAATPAVSQEEVADVVTRALSSDGGGLMLQTTTAVDIANGYNAGRQGGKISEECGIAHDNSVNISTDAFTYALNWNWKLTCTAEKEPQSVSLNFGGRVRYETPKLAVNDSSVAKFEVAGLESDSTLLVFNQTFNRIGSLKFVTDSTTRSYTTLLNYIATNVKVKKSTGRIVSGTAVVTISGASLSGKTFNYAGTITYNSDNTGTFAIKGGGSFVVKL